VWLDFWHTIAQPCLEPCKSHLSEPIGSQTEHCEHSRWSCQHNSSPRINFFSSKKKVSLCYRSIMAFICNPDLGWFLSNAFSLHYQERKNTRVVLRYQMVPVGTCCPCPEPFQRKPEKKERVSKLILGERCGAVQAARDKHCSLQRKQLKDKHPCLLCCPDVWI